MMDQHSSIPEIFKYYKKWRSQQVEQWQLFQFITLVAGFKGHGKITDLMRDVENMDEWLHIWNTRAVRYLPEASGGSRGSSVMLLGVPQAHCQ